MNEQTFAELVRRVAALEGGLTRQRALEHSHVPQDLIRVTATNLTLTTGNQQVCRYDITTERPNAPFFVVGVIDYDHQAAGAGLGIGEIDVDGAIFQGQILGHESAGRGTFANAWTGSFGTVGGHYIRLMSRKLNAGGTVVASGGHSSLSVVVFG